jgi:hypothetical protein
MRCLVRPPFGSSSAAGLCCCIYPSTTVPGCSTFSLLGEKENNVTQVLGVYRLVRFFDQFVLWCLSWLLHLGILPLYVEFQQYKHTNSWHIGQIRLLLSALHSSASLQDVFTQHPTLQFKGKLDRFGCSRAGIIIRNMPIHLGFYRLVTRLFSD